MIEPEKSLWELMEMEAVERYFIDREGFRAERPGVIITSGIWRAPDCKSTEFYTVWFGQGIGHWNFTNLKRARGKVKEILATAKVPIEVRIKRRGEGGRAMSIEKGAYAEGYKDATAYLRKGEDIVVISLLKSQALFENCVRYQQNTISKDYYLGWNQAISDFKGPERR